tara:strand:- start:179 stop:1357 length:1179 start_codon:yes stop_codon:yes gene_type:complete
MSQSIKTLLKHFGKDYYSRSVNPPLVRASTLLFKKVEDIEKEQKNTINKPIGGHFSYGREGTSTTFILQQILRDMEESYDVFLSPTGFGSVFLAIFSVVRPGDEILLSDSIYSPTRLLSEDFLKEFSIKAVFYDPDNMNDLKNNISKKTKLIFVENPGSNTFEFQDLSKIISLAKKKGIFTVMDNTWGTPYFIKPIKLGFDMSVVAATKYYSGHSDLMGGSLAVNKRVFKYVKIANKVSGLRLSPDDAYLIMRGLRTLDIRLEKHQENAKKILNFLSKNKKIVEILYPFKKNTKRYKMWKKYYSGASGLLGLKIKSKNKKSVIKFLNSLKFFGHGYSWGGFESLAMYQGIKELGVRKFLQLRKDEHLIRLHIGLEDPKDLIQDLKRSLRFIK